jgi:hypothetical protein
MAESKGATVFADRARALSKDADPS